MRDDLLCRALPRERRRSLLRCPSNAIVPLAVALERNHDLRHSLLRGVSVVRLVDEKPVDAIVHELCECADAARDGDLPGSARFLQRDAETLDGTWTFPRPLSGLSFQGRAGAGQPRS